MTDATAPLAVIVAGPTASGKSALAMMLAEELNGVVINADSMQVYQELRVLTARPTVEDEAVVPHALYGVRSAAEAGSVAWWRGAALAAMQTAHDAGRLPILCGGTGMYFLSLTQGLSQIPTPSEAARDEARGRLAEFGPSALHADLATVDPKTAARLRPTDGQRLARAWEVWRSSGRGIADWQEDVGEKAPWRFAAIRLDPPRDALRSAITTRFEAMLDSGALDEVHALLEQRLDPSLPAMRAHGVPELSAHIRGETSLKEAATRAELATGQYTKRQATWFRHHDLSGNSSAYTINARFSNLAQFSERDMSDLINFIHLPT